MYRKPWQLRAVPIRFCSHRCHWLANRPIPKTRGDFRMEKNPAWKGGVTIKRAKGNYHGVREVRCPEWAKPMARTNGYVAEHRLVMAEWMGRLLSRMEVVNHLDHNPANNQRANLELWPTNGDHKRGEVGRAVIGVANRRSLTALAPPSSLPMSLSSWPASPSSAA